MVGGEERPWNTGVELPVGRARAGVGLLEDCQMGGKAPAEEQEGREQDGQVEQEG